MHVTGTRHLYGTADVYVEDAPPVTAPSRERGTPFTIVPQSYYVEDEDDYGFRNTVTTVGYIVKKDGTEGARKVRVVEPMANIPDEVWAALLTMRPDLTR